MDLEAAAVAMLVAGCDHSYAAPDDAPIVLLQPIYFMFDRGAHSLRRLASFERQLQWDLHNDPNETLALGLSRRQAGGRLALRTIIVPQLPPAVPVRRQGLTISLLLKLTWQTCSAMNCFESARKLFFRDPLPNA
jgi:hypothetical protein